MSITSAPLNALLDMKSLNRARQKLSSEDVELLQRSQIALYMTRFERLASLLTTS